MVRSVDILKTYFETGDKPTEQQFCELIESFHHKGESITIQNIRVDSLGDSILSLSNGSEITVSGNNGGLPQNNKIRKVYLGEVNLVLPGDVRPVLPDEGSDGGESSSRSIVTGPTSLDRVIDSNSIANLMVQRINQLTSPVVVTEDELILFEMDVNFHQGIPIGPFPIDGDRDEF